MRAERLNNDSLAEPAGFTGRGGRVQFTPRTSSSPRQRAQTLGGNENMIDTYPIMLMFVITLVWVFTVRQNGKLVEAFWDRLPKVAAQELPGTLDRHPEKFIFFFRRRAAKVLRGDEVLWKMRQRLVLWVALSILTPILGMLPLLILALISIR